MKRSGTLRWAVLGTVVSSLFSGAAGAATISDAAAGLSAYNRGDFTTALRIWRDLANDGDVQAQTGMGVLYYNGQGVALDHGEALRWFTLAAEQGDADAQYNLAVMYGHGLAVERDQGQARLWLEQAALQGHRQAVLDLGQGTPIAAASAGRRDRRGGAGDATEQSAQTRYDAGRTAYNRGDFEGALAVWRPLAEADFAAAQTGLGVLYDQGLAGNPDPGAGASWFRRAALAGDAAGQTNLALLHMLGRGVAADDGQALTWLRRAADQGHPLAEYRLGLMVMAGQGVEADPARAVALYRRAALRDYAPAQYNLAVAYDTGVGVARPNPVTAARWYRKAADAALPQAQYNLGVLYLNGIGVARDLVAAHTWFSLAAAFGTGSTAEAAEQLAQQAATRMSSVALSDAALAAFELARGMAAAQGVAMPREVVLSLQAALAREGYDPGPIDGVAGPRTLSALDQLKRRS